MRIPRIKLQWATSRTTPGDWYLGLFGLYRRRSGRGLGLAISLRGVLLWSIAAAIAAYFAGAAYFWWKLQRRNYNYISYTDVLLYPLSAEKRAEIRELQGKALLAEGMDQLKAKQWGRGMMSLRLGLARYPGDLPARLKLAELFLASRLRLKAQETLLEGLDHGWPGRTYLDAALQVATAGEDHEMIIEICDRALELHHRARHPAADRGWLIERRVRALLAEKRAEEALAFTELHASSLDEHLRAELSVVALLDAGRAPEALALAEERFARLGDRSKIRPLLARAYREAGRPDDMARVLGELRAADPADPRGHIFAIVQNLLAGRVAEGRALIDDYVFRFGGTPANYVLAAEPLAEIGRAEELETLLSAAAERGIRDPRLMGARLQVLIAGRRWAEATRQIEDIRAALPAEAASRAVLLDILQRLVAAAADPAEAAQSALADNVRDKQLPMSVYRQCVEVLRRSGRVNTAKQILVFAQGVYPRNRYISETRAALEAEIAARLAAEEAARPAAGPVAAFASAAAFYPELERVLAEKGAPAALAFIRELRQAAPAWVVAEDEPLGRRALEIQAAREDLPALQGVVRFYLSAEPARVRAVLDLATRLHGDGRAAEARMLLTEILRKVPGEPGATALLKRWFPPPKPADPAPESP